MADRPVLARLAAALVGAWLVPLLAVPAAAHEPGGVGATNFATTLSALDPPVAGLDLTAVDGGSRLRLRNTTEVDAVVAGYEDEPYLRVGPAGVFANEASPTAHLSGAVAGGPDGALEVRAGAVDSAGAFRGAPRWRQISPGSEYTWHDHRTHWVADTLPPVVAQAGRSAHHLRDFTITIEYGGQALRATGSLDWVPGPSPWPWFALILLVAAAVVAAARLGYRAFGVATAVVVATALAYGLGAAVRSGGSAPARLALLVGDGLLPMGFATLGAVVLWRARTEPARRAGAWIATLAGVLVAGLTVLAGAAAWWRSSVPSAFPATAVRAVLAVTAGAGLGLLPGLPLLLRRHHPAAP